MVVTRRGVTWPLGALLGVLFGAVIVACGASQDDEHPGTSAWALEDDASADREAGASGCREISLHVRRTAARAAPQVAREHDEAAVSPSLAFFLPATVKFSEGAPKKSYMVVFGYDEARCTYETSPGSRSLVGHLVSCDSGAVAGDLVSASMVSLDLLGPGAPISARIELDEAPPCVVDAGGGGSADASVDTGGGGTEDAGAGTEPDASADTGVETDAGAETDAAVDAGPPCSAETCVSAGPCMVAECTSTGCSISPAPLGVSCPNTGPCVVGVCDGAGSCVPAAAADGVPCDDGNACSTGDRCLAGACAPGAPRVCPASGPCFETTCDSSLGCQELPKVAGSSCEPDPPNLCDGAAVCDGAGACLPGTPPIVDDGLMCTVDSCRADVGPIHTPIPNCDPTPVQGASPFEPRASLLGRLVSASGGAIGGATFTVSDAPLPGASSPTPRSDVTVASAGDGSFRLRLMTFPDAEPEGAPPLHVLVKIDAPGVLSAYRDAWLHTGTAADLGTIKMMARDPAVTTIGPEGGTASDSRGLVEVVIPAGALSSTVPIQITPFDTRDAFPAPLPDATPTLYGLQLEPDGQRFSAPVTVRVANSRGVPTSLVIPAGYYDVATGRWEHAASATWDGARFTFQTDHFSTYDCNFSKPRDPKPKPGDGPDNEDCKTCPCPGKGTGSDATLTGGSLRQRFALPTYRVRGDDIGVTLSYDSGLAGARRLGAAPSDYAAAGHSTFAVSTRPLRITAASTPTAADRTNAPILPNGCSGVATRTALGRPSLAPFTIEQAFAGASWSQSFLLSDLNKEAEAQAFVSLPLVGGEVAGSGLYVARTVLRADTPDSCVASGGTFGVSDAFAPGVSIATEAAPLATFERHVLVNHRVSSPYGAGWTLEELSRVHRAGDRAFLAGGDGSEETFRPRAYSSLVGYVAPHQLARDPITGEVFLARIDGLIQRVEPATKTFTTVLSGLPLSAGPQGFAIGYVGSARRFLVWADTQLFEIDAAGAVSVLATRGASATYQQASVAARGDLVVFTDAITPTLSSVRLSDPARAVAAISSASGGDVRLSPRAPLSGVTFGSPRGLDFAPDGTLYVADVRKNAVYAVSPLAGGEIGPASRVDAVVGDGTSGLLPLLGERYPGPKLIMPEPLGVTVAEDGTVFVITSFGAAAYDPIAREAEWRVYFAGIDEMMLDPANYVSFVALTPTTLLTRHDAGNRALMRIDIDRMSSEFEPTRTLTRTAGGGLELLDTTAATLTEFDAVGRLIRKKKRTGELLMQVAYLDARSDKVDFITDPVGDRITFGYDGAGKLERITDARGRVTSVHVDGLGDLVRLTRPDLDSFDFAYAEHRMTSKRAPTGDVSTYTFRADGTVATLTKPEGATTTIDAVLSHPPAYDASGALVRSGGYTDAHGVVHEIVVNRRGDIEKDSYVADGVARVEEAVYASDGFVYDDSAPSETSRRNTLLRVAYRTLNGVPLGPARRFWDPHYRPTIENAPSHNADTHGWWYTPDGWLRAERTGNSVYWQAFDRDAAGHVTSAYDSWLAYSNDVPYFPISGAKTDYTYRPDGQVATVTERGDSRLNTKTFLYDDAGGTLNEVGWTDTLGRSMTYTRDVAGNITMANDGTATTFSVFDAMNRLVETRDALGNATTYAYADASCGCSRENLVTSIHTPDLPAGVSWQMTYDRDGRFASVTDPHGFTESYEYEPTGELKKTTDKRGRITTWTHDLLGRVATMVDALGRAHLNSYSVPTAGAWQGPMLLSGSGDAAAPPSSLSSALRSGEYQIGQNAYPRDGYPAQITLYRDATFELGFTRYFDANKRQTFRFDRQGIAIDSAFVPSTWQAQNAPHAWRSEDSWNIYTSKPVQTTLSSAPNYGQFYQDAFFDNVYERGFAPAYGSAVEQLQRDAAGRVARITRGYYDGEVAGPPETTSTYTYRPDGRLGRLVNVDGVHDFAYDPRGLVQTQTVSDEGTYQYGWDALGRSSLLTYPDGHTRAQTFDDLGRLTSRCYDYGLGTVRCYTAQYDAVGNPVRMTDPDGVDVLEYDALDRLTKLTRYSSDGVTSLGEEVYAYNALGALKVNAGALLDDQRPRKDGAGLADAAVPASLGGQPVTLDAGGFVTSLRGTAFSFDLRGLLRAAQEPIPAPSESYSYDARLRRFFLQRGSSAMYFLYEGLDLVGVMDSVPWGSRLVPSQVLESYLFDGVDHPLRIKRGATTAHYELDLAGNVRALRLAGGAHLGSYRYSAFGKTVEDTTTFDQPLRWKGRWFSPLAGGIYDVRARQWSPELGVFLAIDEFEFHDRKTTLWGWPGQNPARYSDIYGRGQSGGGGSTDDWDSPPDGGDKPCKPDASGKWSCTASCNLDGKEPQCTGRVTGSASGPSEEEACREAKRDATQKAPRGCYARHCQCRCEKR